MAAVTVLQSARRASIPIAEKGDVQAGARPKEGFDNLGKAKLPAGWPPAP